MKKVWLINYYSYPPGTSNWRRHFDLAKELINKKFQIDIIAGSYVHDRQKHLLDKDEKVRIQNYSGINYHILNGISYRSSIKRIISMIEFMIKVFFYEKEIDNKPDIIYCSCPHPFNGLISLYLSKKYKAKFLLEIRDLWPETWVEMGAISRRSLIYKIFFLIEKKLYVKADKIVTLMPEAYKYIEKLGINKEKVEYISNGIDLEEFDQNVLTETTEIVINKQEFNIFYTGAHGKANCLERVLDVAELLRDNKMIKFHLVGDGPEKNFLNEIVFKKKLDNVKFYSSVRKEKIPSILKKADCLIVVSKKSNLYKYGISFNKIFEYMASKKPIIFSGNVINDIVKESKSGISVEAENSLEIKKAILKIYNLNTQEREILGENGRKYVEENFSTKSLAKKLEKVLGEL